MNVYLHKNAVMLFYVFLLCSLSILTILCCEIIILNICLPSLLQGKFMIYCENSLFIWPATTEKNKLFVFSLICKHLTACILLKLQPVKCVKAVSNL